MTKKEVTITGWQHDGTGQTTEENNGTMSSNQELLYSYQRSDEMSNEQIRILGRL